jgi:formylglycine-generating enzyme required for sulfatase activity
LRLPTEAEWEYAAQGGQGYDYGTSTGGIGPELANYNAGDRSYGVAEALRYLKSVGPKPIGSYDPNPFGIYDLAGSVWEWCSSEYKPYPYRVGDEWKEIQTNIDKNVNLRRVVRGGSWSLTDNYTRARNRLYTAPAYTFYSFGLRCARAPRP